MRELGKIHENVFIESVLATSRFFGGKSTKFWLYMSIDAEFFCDHFGTKILVLSSLRRRKIDFIFGKTTNNYIHIVTSSMTSSSWVICQMKAWKLLLSFIPNWDHGHHLVALESKGKKHLGIEDFLEFYLISVSHEYESSF